MSSSPVKPVTAADKKLSREHLKDSLHYNFSHAKGHLEQAEENIKKLKERGDTYPKSKIKSYGLDTILSAIKSRGGDN